MQDRAISRDKCLNPRDLKWLRGRDLNPRPSGYEPDELPGCSTPRLGIPYIHPLVSLRNRKVCLFNSSNLPDHRTAASLVAVEKDARDQTLGLSSGVPRDESV